MGLRKQRGCSRGERLVCSLSGDRTGKILIGEEWWKLLEGWEGCGMQVRSYGLTV